MGADLSSTGTLLDQALEAVRLAVDEPREAVALAQQVAEHRDLDAEASAVLERALGLAARELDDVAAARRHFLASITHAEGGGFPARAAEARLSLAAELISAGRPAAALRELGRASRDLAEDHPQLHAQLALVYARLGRYDEALAANSRALAIAENQRDHTRVALILTNRALVQAYRGQLAAAERDVRRAWAICSDRGERFAASEAQHNLAWVLGRRGRLPESLALFDEVEPVVVELGISLAVHRLDRAEVLLMAGLVREAQAVARDAADELADGGHDAERPEALLLLARAALLAGDPITAASAAAEAAADFLRQDRATWAVTAQAVQVQAKAASGDSPETLAEAIALGTDLHGRGLFDEEADVRLMAGRLAARLGRPDLAAAQLAPLAAMRRRRSARDRVIGWQAEHVLRVVDGDLRGALSAARAAVRVLAESRTGLGATDLHAASARHAAAVTTSALGLALTGRAAAVLFWSETQRSSTLQYSPVRPPSDADLATDLERLRSVAVLRHQALLDDEPAQNLHREQLALEESVRRRSRHASASRSAALATPTLPQLRRQLADRRMVSLFASDGRLHALVVTRRRTEVLDLASEVEVMLELRHLRLALRRAVLGQPRADDAARVGAQRLDALLQRAFAGEEPLVIVPHAGLAALPWSLLPAVARRVVDVTPSLSLWSRPQDQRARAGRVAVAGPGLAHADAEVAGIATGYRDMSVLTGADANCAAVLEGLDGAQLAHLACHGRFRSDNPLFSSLLLADGPLVVYDLERLNAAPEHVVLSACDSGRTGERAGEELLGLAAAFFSLGTRTLIASVVPVDDVATGQLMTALHQHWRTGLAPASALRAAQADHPGPTAAAFVCLTAGQSQAVSG